MSTIEYDSSKSWDTPYRVVVGTTPVKVVTDGYRPTRGVQIKALFGNSDTIYIGKSDVATTTGYPLEAGKSVFLPVDDIQDVYAVSGTAAQGIAVIAI